MSLNAKYRGKKPKKYFENKYADSLYTDGGDLKNKIHYLLPKGALDGTFLSFFENYENTPEAYLKDPTIPCHLERMSQPHWKDAHQYALKHWWTSLRTDTNLKILFQEKNINFLQDYKTQEVVAPYPISQLDRYIQAPIEFETLDKSGHIQKMLANDKLKNAIAGIPEELLMWLCLLLPYWVKYPHDLPANTTSKQLVNSLLAKYEVPACLLFNLLNKEHFDFDHFLIYLMIGQGVSIYKLGPKFGIEFPKKYISYTSELPEKTDINNTFTHAIVRSFGGTATDFNRIKLHSYFRFHIRSDYPISRFKEATIGWIIQNREKMTNHQCAIILDWAVHAYTEQLRNDRRDSGAKFWSRRSFDRTLERSMVYTQDRKEKRPFLSWKGCDLNMEKTHKVYGDIKVVELLNNIDLYEEGVLMKHCVHVYDKRCFQRKSAMFSLRINHQRKLTIELDPKRKLIVQARGKQNRPATFQELDILNLWKKEVIEKS